MYASNLLITEAATLTFSKLPLNPYQMEPFIDQSTLYICLALLISLVRSKSVS